MGARKSIGTIKYRYQYPAYRRYPQLGPDGTGVGHILWYTLDAPTVDLGEQRALQDWYIKFALQNVEGVSEIASFGGFKNNTR
ncbi:hypothetical protein [Paraflavitalea speifideaquila]|uniref:hypothetical protein n=1 Tax=Paraflavitalea speifideaquila TaxID=3076558 RepID=UPI0028EAA52E|nr:hypothetical protein [Paraflavitalea speifideiaquila]